MTKCNIEIDRDHIPKEFIERCIKGHIGGVVLVFVTGKDIVEREKKVNEVKDFAKAMRIKYETL